MERVRKAVRTLALAVILCAMLTTVVFAAENGSVWLKVTDASDGTGVTAMIVADTTVTDGLVTLTYDSSKLTYEGITVDEDYVAMYAVNADEEGVVKISWVAPEAYQTDGSAFALICVNFSGKTSGSVTLSGSVRDAEGNEVALTQAPDTAALEKAIAEAEKLKASKYTPESYAAVEDALAAAKAVLADPCATQSQIDAAAKALNDAMAALVRATGNNPGMGDSSMIGLAVCLLAVSGAGLTALYIFNKRRYAR